MKNISKKIIVTILLASSLSLASANAQQNAETAARQAQIDGDEATAKLGEIEEDAAENAVVEGADAPEVGVDAAEADIEERRIDNAEAREEQADGDD